ncbi:UNVERIFIED_CONTAM: hypothetical protein HDU68_011348 [Siphonaria sp. JEL0065]|nr:hypothetical protein HDU68_011348 [Siphonaria sp. JEL0065]
MYTSDFHQTQYSDFLLSTPPQEYNTLLGIEQQRNNDMKPQQFPMLLSAIDHNSLANPMLAPVRFNDYSFMEMMNIAPLDSPFTQQQLQQQQPQFHFSTILPTTPKQPETSLEASPPTSPTPTATAKPSSKKDKKDKKMRFRATDQELSFLLKIFESNPFPSTKFRAQIAQKMNLTERQVLFWFQNRRATLKTNGIVAVKPKRIQNADLGPGAAVMVKGKHCSLSPLSSENPFFYVASAVGGHSGVEDDE